MLLLFNSNILEIKRDICCVFYGFLKLHDTDAIRPIPALEEKTHSFRFYHGYPRHELFVNEKCLETPFLESYFM